MTSTPNLKDLANAIRALSMDAIEKAKSGHPGAPLGMADIATVLWLKFLRHNPLNPMWPNRDRFVLSNGHASMLLYSLLYLTGYDLTIDDIKQFRQLGSKTPGHPEFSHTPGVETTTGPLGQGVANAVGMAIAEKILAATFTRPGLEIVDHYTYAFVGDGCLMEGISHECCSLAGTLGLGKLILFYDQNGISIDGPVDGWFSEDVATRFRAYGWHVIEDVDGHNYDAIETAIKEAKEHKDHPSIICCKTKIGFGSPSFEGSPKCHGAPLGEEEIKHAKERLGWSYPPFVIPDEIKNAWDSREKGQEDESKWQELFSEYEKKYPDLASEFKRRMSGMLPENFDFWSNKLIDSTLKCKEKLATRKASLKVLNAIGPQLKELIGGSADLGCSNLTLWSGVKPVSKDDWQANYIHYGVREFAMAAIMNGLSLHGGFIPYGGTFLVFSDYMRNAMRMAALMGIRVIYVLTHDSIGVGEDGPTHQPIEHIESLRLIPNMNVWRPCDLVETSVAWIFALKRKDGPSALILSRQGLTPQNRKEGQEQEIFKGGYRLYEPSKGIDALVIATGSEVELAIEAAKECEKSGIGVLVVSMPSREVFEAQDESWKNYVIPPDVKARVVVEAGSRGGWFRYVEHEDQIISIDRFGASAPGATLFKEFGFDVEHVVDAIKRAISRSKGQIKSNPEPVMA